MFKNISVEDIKNAKPRKTSYDIYLEEFWSKHRKIEFAVERSWDAYEKACKQIGDNRLGTAKTVDHYSMDGDAYLLENGQVIEVVQSTSGYYPPQVRAFDNLQDWQEYTTPMPYAIYARG